MKILISTKETQGKRKSDFSWTNDNELVKLGSECDNDKNQIDGGCGCRRSFVGFESLKATTTATVIDKPITKEHYLEALKTSLTKSGYMSFLKDKDVLIEATELLRIADCFNVGDIIEKRGVKFQSRV